MRNIRVLPLILVLVASCNRNVINSRDKIDESIVQRESNDFFAEDEFGIMDTLYLEVVLADCGEWGGPLEVYKIYEDKEKRYGVEYKKHKYVCDSLDKYYDKNPIVAKKKSLNLSVTGTHLISDFFIELMNEKVGKMPFTSHAGNVFILYDRDSTLFMRVHTDSKKVKDKYLEFKNSLDLSK